MSLQDKYAQFTRSASCNPEKKMCKLEELDTYEYIFFLGHLIGLERTEVFTAAVNFNWYEYECGSVSFGRESVAAAFLQRHTQVNKYKLCEETHVNVLSLDRMMRKISRDIMRNIVLYDYYSNGGW
jgi:hypothetical protein